MVAPINKVAPATHLTRWRWGLQAFCVWLALCGGAWGQEVVFSGEAALTGQTLYFTTKAGMGHADVGEYWNGTAWATYTTTRSTWKVAMSEVGVTGDFTGTLHSGAVGPIIVKIYQDANDDGTPSHTDDILLETQTGYWNGAVFYTNVLVSDGTGTGQINTTSGSVATSGGGGGDVNVIS